LAEVRKLGNTIELKIESPVLRLKILEMFEFDGEGGLEWAFET
jgi:hypothetical protein